MSSDDSRKGANRRPATAEELAEIAAVRSANDLLAFILYFNDQMESKVWPKLEGNEEADAHYGVLSDLKNLPVLIYLWVRTVLCPRARQAAGVPRNGERPVVSVGGIGGAFWKSEENRRQYLAKVTGQLTPFQRSLEASDEEKYDLDDEVKKEKQKHVMRVKRVIDAACAAGLACRTTIRNNNLVAVRGTDELRELLLKLFSFRAAANRSRKGP
jgi:hypothetical protein